MYLAVLLLYAGMKKTPFRIEYANEKAVDTGGVCRDMLSAFWQEAFATAFDGRNVVVPSIVN